MNIKDYDLMLFEILRPLVIGDDPIKLYHNVIDEDFDSQTLDYVVYSTGLSDTPRLYGDGKVVLRRCSCDITVNEAGTGNNENSGYLVRRIEEILIQNRISYTKTKLGYIESTDSTQTNFDFFLE